MLRRSKSSEAIKQIDLIEIPSIMENGHSFSASQMSEIDRARIWNHRDRDPRLHLENGAPLLPTHYIPVGVNSAGYSNVAPGPLDYPSVTFNPENHSAIHSGSLYQSHQPPSSSVGYSEFQSNTVQHAQSSYMDGSRMVIPPENDRRAVPKRKTPSMPWVSDGGNVDPSHYASTSSNPHVSSNHLQPIRAPGPLFSPLDSTTMFPGYSNSLPTGYGSHRNTRSRQSPALHIETNPARHFNSAANFRGRNDSRFGPAANVSGPNAHYYMIMQQRLFPESVAHSGISAANATMMPIHYGTMDTGMGYNGTNNQGLSHYSVTSGHPSLSYATARPSAEAATASSSQYRATSIHPLVSSGTAREVATSSSHYRAAFIHPFVSSTTASRPVSLETTAPSNRYRPSSSHAFVSSATTYRATSSHPVASSAATRPSNVEASEPSTRYRSHLFGSSTTARQSAASSSHYRIISSHPFVSSATARATGVEVAASSSQLSSMQSSERNTRARNSYERSSSSYPRLSWGHGVNEVVVAIEPLVYYVDYYLFDEYSDVILDIDALGYEDLVALEEMIGNADTGLPEDVASRCLIETIYHSSDRIQDDGEQGKCVICQEEYEDMEKLGKLSCGHDFHVSCIKKWLMIKNVCPICKVPAMSNAPNERS